MSSAGEALSVCPRPVFWEELDFLGLDKLGWHYPRSKEPLLWACERRYFYKGELVLEVKGGNLFDAPVAKPIVQNLHLVPIDIDYLHSINEDSLFLLEHEAMSFIFQVFTTHYNQEDNRNDKINYELLANNLFQKTKTEHAIIKEDCGSLDFMPVSLAQQLGKKRVFNSKIDIFIVSFSGGKDSQVVLDLVSRVLPPTTYVVVYSDTGYELPTSLELYNTVSDLYKKKYPDLQFYTAKNHQPVLYYWDKLDSPSKIHRWCCGVMKTAPLYRLLKEISGKGCQPNVLAYEGVRAEESSQRASYDRIGTGVKHNNVVNVRPIFEWSVTEVWLYLLFHHLPLNAAYRKGLNRVGCVICPLSSELGDCLDYSFFKKTAQPFVDKLRYLAKSANIPNVDIYLKERKWKVRAGGNRHLSKTSVSYKINNTDFIASVDYPQEDIFQWLKTLGKYKIVYSRDDNCELQLSYKNILYTIYLACNECSIKITAKNCSSDIVFVGLLKRIINKVGYCAHCEVCEVECPAGALSVVPKVEILEDKCVHCLRCLMFKDNGCVVANSIKTSSQTNQNKMKSSKTPINKFNTFGLRKRWVKLFIDNKSTFFDGFEHGLNVKKQIPIFVNWLKVAELIKGDSKEYSPFAELLSGVFANNQIGFWEIIWINLSCNSDLCSWFCNKISYNCEYSREELSVLLSETFSEIPESGRDNALKALLNTFKESPLGAELKVGVVLKEGNKTSVLRTPHNELSLVATAYSLYRYAEKIGRYLLTVSEFYNPEQTEGIVKQFGIERNAFEQNLRSLEHDSNHVLRAELKMGLDNIILREDLTSADIIELMLKD